VSSAHTDDHGIHAPTRSAPQATLAIWLVTTRRDPAALKPTAGALAIEGLAPIAELTVQQAKRYARHDGVEHPDVLVLLCDLAREDCTMLRAFGRLMPSARSIVVSPVSNSVAVRRALDMGASGLVDEHRVEQTLAIAVRAVSAGLVTLSHASRWSAEKPVFSYREKQALGLVVEGLSNGEIAVSLGLSQSTIKSHLASAFAKLGVHSRSEAAALILDPQAGLASIALPPRQRAFTRVATSTQW
jgi:DNA-binding NarL/FixJ family response regulator